MNDSVKMSDSIEIAKYHNTMNNCVLHSINKTQIPIINRHVFFYFILLLFVIKCLLLATQK